MTLRADDGTLLKPKEGIVLDQNGNPLTPAPHRAWRDPDATDFSGHSRVFVWRSGGLLAPLIIAPILVVLVAVGLTLMGGFGALAILAWAVFLLRRLLYRVRYRH